MSRLVLVLFIVSFVACKKKEGGKTDVTAPTRQDAQAEPAAPDATTAAVAPSGAPAAVDQTARAKQLLDSQIAALLKPEDAAITATFDPEAVVLVPDPRKVSAPIGLRAAITRLAPSVEVKKITSDKLVVGGNADALWLTAELTVVQDKATETVRVTELATAAAGWKVVAAAFSEPSAPRTRKQGNGDVDGATDPGPLSPLLADPTKLAGALANDAVVIGPTETAQGADAAKQLIGTWTGLALEGKTREVRGATWGYALGYVQRTVADQKSPYRLAILVVGVPDGSAWKIVAVHVASL